MGMGFPDNSQFNATPVFVNMIDQGKLCSPVFSMLTCYNASTFNDEDPYYGGKITFGGIDKNLYTGEITWARLNEERHWRFQMNGIKICDEIFYAGSSAAVDSGSEIFCEYKKLIFVWLSEIKPNNN